MVYVVRASSFLLIKYKYRFLSFLKVKVGWSLKVSSVCTWDWKEIWEDLSKLCSVKTKRKDNLVPGMMNPEHSWSFYREIFGMPPSLCGLKWVRFFSAEFSLSENPRSEPFSLAKSNRTLLDPLIRAYCLQQIKK